MTLHSIRDKLGLVFKPFARLSDAALAAVGYRENIEETKQPIPVNLAVKSALLLPPIYIVASFLLTIMLDNAGVQAPTHQIQPQFAWIIACGSWLLWGGIGLLLAPLQVRRVRRLNRQARWHRLSDLERMAKRETAIQENALDLSRYAVTDSSIQIVTGS